MFLGKLYRKKRKVLLQPLPVPPPKRTSMSWAQPTSLAHVREQQWFESTARSHDAFCGCGDSVLHFTNLATRFNRLHAAPSPLDPPYPPPPRRARVRGLPALPAPENPPAPWPGAGGDAAGNPEGGPRGQSTGDAAGDDFDPADLEDLLAAVEEDEQ